MKLIALADFPDFQYTREDRTLAFLHRHPGIEWWHLRSKLGPANYDLDGALKPLKDQNLIHVEGKDRFSKIFLTTAGQAVADYLEYRTREVREGRSKTV